MFRAAGKTAPQCTVQYSTTTLPSLSDDKIDASLVKTALKLAIDREHA